MTESYGVEKTVDVLEDDDLVFFVITEPFLGDSWSISGPYTSPFEAYQKLLDDVCFSDRGTHEYNIIFTKKHSYEKEEYKGSEVRFDIDEETKERVRSKILYGWNGLE